MESLVNDDSAGTQGHQNTIVSLVDGDALDEESERRERLNRRPSFKKILTDLSGTDHLENIEEEGTTQSAGDEEGGQDGGASQGAVYASTAGTAMVLPAGSIQIADGGPGLQTLTMSNSAGTAPSGPAVSGSGAGNGPTAIVQYAPGPDGQQQFFMTSPNLQAYQLATAAGSVGSAAALGAASGSVSSNQQLSEEAARKRELRLLKNRDAAKECRRKKKEYIKCLENRVAVLENQNRTLMEELKALKDLYCNSKD